MIIEETKTEQTAESPHGLREELETDIETLEDKTKNS
jgi:hypothetical protein